MFGRISAGMGIVKRIGMVETDPNDRFEFLFHTNSERDVCKLNLHQIEARRGRCQKAVMMDSDRIL